MRASVKKIFPKNSTTFKLLKNLYYKYINKNKCGFDYLQEYADYKANINFIQIGSNDGLSGDSINNFIKKNKWSGILVEPVPSLFAELKNNYRGFEKGLIFENSAIATVNGKVKFYRVEKKEPSTDDKVVKKVTETINNDNNFIGEITNVYDQLGTFKKEVLLNHRSLIPNIEDLIVEDTVNAITFESLLKKHNISKLNLLLIDTEGYDFEIIKMVSFDKLDIDLIVFEHKHLSNLDYKKAKQILLNNGFTIKVKDDFDTIAVKKSILKIISKNYSLK